MKKFKKYAVGIALCLLEIAIGILLLINPQSFTSAIIIGGGIMLMLGGIVCIIKYFRMSVDAAAVSQELLKGMIMLLVGGFCILKSGWFLAAFPLLTLAYGIVILLTGLGKIQWMMNMLRKKQGRWYLAAISAVVSIGCAIVILKNPFATAAILWMFTGISLIVEAVLDLVALLMSESKNIKKKAPEMEEANEAESNEQQENTTV